MIRTTVSDATSAVVFNEKIYLCLQWYFPEISCIWAGVIGFDDKNQAIKTVNHSNKKEFNGAVEYCGCTVLGRFEGDNEVFSIDFDKMPANVVRLACMAVCSNGKKLSEAKNSFTRLVFGAYTLCMQQLSFTDSDGAFICFFQRSTSGAWFFQTAMNPISGKSTGDSIRDVSKILSAIHLFKQ